MLGQLVCCTESPLIRFVLFSPPSKTLFPWPSPWGERQQLCIHLPLAGRYVAVAVARPEGRGGVNFIRWLALH